MQKVVDELIEGRRLAGQSIAQGAAKIGISYSHLWNVEHGLAELTEAQVTDLRAHYAQLIHHRLERFRNLVETGEKHD